MEQVCLLHLMHVLCGIVAYGMAAPHAGAYLPGLALLRIRCLQELLVCGSLLQLGTGWIAGLCLS